MEAIILDYIEFCKNYFIVTGIPVSLLKGNISVYSAAVEVMSIEPDKYLNVGWNFDLNETEPVFCHISPDIEYGCVSSDESDYHIIIGPVFSIPVTEDIVNAYMNGLAVPKKYREATEEFLCSIPLLTHRKFISHLVFLYMSINHKNIGPLKFLKSEEISEKNLEQQQAKVLIENNSRWNSYNYDNEIYRCIRSGNIEELEQLFETSLPEEGKLASTPLRQAKNYFIATAVKAGIMGAIPGGFEAEKTYHMIDLYIRECEKLQSIEAVKSFQYSMLKDLLRKTADSHIPAGISEEVFICMNYIRSHRNEPLRIDDVAKQINRSRSYTLKHFKEELGINMGAFIIRCRLEDAKMLLSYSNKSLSEISDYLCFATQSHFQNAFKKQYGITPAAFRKQNHKI